MKQRCVWLFILTSLVTGTSVLCIGLVLAQDGDHQDSNTRFFQFMSTKSDKGYVGEAVKSILGSS